MFRIVLFLLFFGTPVAATQKVVLGTILFEPFSTIDPNTNTCVGTAIDITRRILSEYDFDLEVVCANASRIYRMVENSEVDFTINVKTTSALAKNVEFIEQPFRKLELNLYTRIASSQRHTVAAIRGFDYNGYRKSLLEKGYEFIDLPNSISASRLFNIGRVENLISYSGPVEYYVKNHVLTIDDSILITPLDEITSHFAISKKSIHIQLLKGAFNDYANTHAFEYFVESGRLTVN
jgi:polar amino acid transport system substrate-binding protein